MWNAVSLFHKKIVNEDEFSARFIWIKTDLNLAIKMNIKNFHLKSVLNDGKSEAQSVLFLSVDGKWFQIDVRSMCNVFILNQSLLFQWRERKEREVEKEEGERVWWIRDDLENEYWDENAGRRRREWKARDGLNQKWRKGKMKIEKVGNGMSK